ncbi:conserved protein of unknown function [Rhodovastum atsumiense]|uniref:Uncharacterized protein n=1 Tax=Rhodovastum atsumiense TaxID=504468 RepID=A0A5M6IW71_9PROT|nr:hypothetical protein [Rhodovastum atsumiense]KAA5612580.1 hypothetical protein F1189_08985 [Rhodovastum atsumiense]CAH2601325.1 conserved protein of unknown function [Rhodovastum atsumiense]
MTDYTDALAGITQTALDACDPTFSAGRSGIYAYLTIGRMHGVCVTFADRHDVNGEVPSLIRDGVVLRFLIPRGASLDDLVLGLAEGGHLSTLIDTVLEGHVLTLGPDSATGRLTDAAAAARDDLLETIGALGPLAHFDDEAFDFADTAPELKVFWSMPDFADFADFDCDGVPA